MELRKEAKRIVEHYREVVLRGKKDQQRTTALPMVEMLLMGDQEPERLMLAADRYAMELEKDSLPMGAKTFYGRHWQEFLSDDWEPPEDDGGDLRWSDQHGGYVR